MGRIRVLVVDDSVVVRKVVSEELAAHSDIEVVGTAPNGKIALAKIAQGPPDLVVLDVEMPEMDGIETLRRLRASHPKVRVIMFSTLTETGASVTLDALSLGASDYFVKPTGVGGVEESRRILREQLVPSIRSLCPSKEPAPSPAPPPSTTRAPSVAGRVDAVVIGSSTGGPNALAELFRGLPELNVPVLIVQHMPPMFTKQLADRLTRSSRIPVVEAVAGDEIVPGRAWIAPGDWHLTVARDGVKVRAQLDQEPLENSVRPAVDRMFRSAVKVWGRNILAVILTGMGQDGLRGCEAVSAAGGQTIVQDEATSVVWGMPGAVARAGLADRVIPLATIAAEIARRVRGDRA